MVARNGAGSPRTIGVEEELLLVDPATGRPVAAVEEVMAAAQGLPAGRAPGPCIEREAKREQLEVVSPPCASLDGIADLIVEGRGLAAAAARRAGVLTAALGTSVVPTDTHVTPSARYEALRRRYGMTMHEQLTCGFHVHVAVHSDEEGVAVLDRIRPWLPVLLALTGNSPFWSGRDSGFASYRYQAWGRWPSAGPYDRFGTPEAYRRTVGSFISTGVVLDPGMIYFDARLSEHFPTVEVRAADVCLDADHAVVVAGLVRALVETAAEEWRDGVCADPVETSLLRLAMWSASRFGVAEDGLVNPLLGEPWTARAAAQALLAHVGPALDAAGDRERVEMGVEQILRSGTGADRQRRVLGVTGRLRDVVLDAAEVTNRGSASPRTPTAA